MNSAIPLDKLLARFEIRGQLKVLFLEPFARSEPEKANPASQGKDDVQKTRTLRAPDLSKVQLGASGEKLYFLN